MRRSKGVREYAPIMMVVVRELVNMLVLEIWSVGDYGKRGS